MEHQRRLLSKENTIERKHKSARFLSFSLPNSCFQLQVDYYSNEANKNKYNNLQLVASRKSNLKIAEEQIVQGIYLQRQLVMLCCLDLKVLCCLDQLLLECIFFKCKLCLFEQDISRSIFISIRYTLIKTNTVAHNTGPQGCPLLSTNVVVSSLHGLVIASLRINQIYIKIDKVKVKPYLRQNHSLG